MRTVLKKRPGLLLIWLVLLFVVPMSLGARCDCDDPDLARTEKIRAESGDRAWKPDTFRANFAGDPPYEGFGFVNGAPIVIYPQGMVAANNEASFDVPTGDGIHHEKGLSVYVLEGAYDEKTGQLTATMTLTTGSEALDQEQRCGIRNTFEYKGTLTAKKVNEKAFEGSVTGTQTITQVFTYCESFGVAPGTPGYRADETEVRTYVLNWTFAMVPE